MYELYSLPSTLSWLHHLHSIIRASSPQHITVHHSLCPLGSPLALWCVLFDVSILWWVFSTPTARCNRDRAHRLTIAILNSQKGHIFHLLQWSYFHHVFLFFFVFFFIVVEKTWVCLLYEMIRQISRCARPVCPVFHVDLDPVWYHWLVL